MPVSFPHNGNAAPASAYGNLPYVYNLSPQNLTRWRVARAKVKSNAANARVLCIGDSTMIGINAAGVANWPSVTDYLASLLNSGGLAASANGFAGWSFAGATSGSRLGTDTRMAAGSWTSAVTSGGTLGGAILQSSAAGAPFTYTPTAAVDTAAVTYIGNASGGTVGMTLGSGTTNTVTLNHGGANILGTATATNTLGVQALSLNFLTGSTNYILAVETYNAAVKCASIINAGWWGATTANFITNAAVANALPTLQYLAPALTVICLGINDWDSSVPLNTYIANMQSIITAAQASGDVILLTPTPNANNLALQAQYMSALYGLAAVNKCALVDNAARWVSYAAANALGFYADTLHPNTQGYADQTTALAQVLLTV